MIPMISFQPGYLIHHTQFVGGHHGPVGGRGPPQRTFPGPQTPQECFGTIGEGFGEGSFFEKICFFMDPHPHPCNAACLITAHHHRRLAGPRGESLTVSAVKSLLRTRLLYFLMLIIVPRCFLSRWWHLESAKVAW